MSSAVALCFLVFTSFVIGNANRLRQSLFMQRSTWNPTRASDGRTSQCLLTAIFQSQLRLDARRFVQRQGVPENPQSPRYLETRALPLYSLLTSLPKVLPLSIESQAIPYSGGLTFDRCRKTSQCKGIRRCLDLTDFPESRLCDDAERCFCLPPEPDRCTHTSHCVPGEVCANLRNLTTPLCVSAVVEDESAAFVEVSSENQAENPGPPLYGLTYDFCQEQEDCSGDRTCIYLDRYTAQLCGGRDPCVCLPPLLETCASSDTCPKGEVCVVDPGSPTRDVCVSDSTAREFPDVFVPSKPPPGSSVNNGSAGLTLDACENSADCLGTRACFQSPASSGVICPDVVFASCRCYPVSPGRCQDSEDCGLGEICGVEVETGFPLCVSKNAVEEDPSLITDPDLPPIDGGEAPDAPFAVDDPLNTALAEATASSSESQTGDVSGASSSSGLSPSPTASLGPSPDLGVCIDAKALRHFRQDELVFQENVQAKVLCDSDNNCATDGHMVMYRGKAVMMMTYCREVSCVERVMLVNSPRYRRGMRVASNSRDMQFTAFAAKYASTAEEALLSMATRIGM